MHFLSYLFVFLAPPSIFHYDAALQAGTKENVTLVCHARGVPAPEFTWMTPQGIVNGTSSIYEKEYLDDGSFRTRGKILQDDGSLLVFNTRVYDKGSYTCVAVNVMGKDERTVNLTVSRGKIRQVSCFILVLAGSLRGRHESNRTR